MNYRIVNIILVIALLTACCSCSTLFKPKAYNNLKHCTVELAWAQTRDAAWTRASTVMEQNGWKPITKCKKITIKEGLKINPKTGQWGNFMIYPDGSEFWYAGLSSTYTMTIVGTPTKQPYARSLPIMTHEAAESILSANGCPWSNDARNTYLWSNGL